MGAELGGTGGAAESDDDVFSFMTIPQSGQLILLISILPYSFSLGKAELALP
jgi:hypothetical protein